MALKPINVELARASECMELAELSRVAIEYDLRWRWKSAKVLELIRDPNSTVIRVRDDKERLLGFAAMQFKKTHAHLLLLATTARSRRQGIGASMLAWLEQSASVAGLDFITLEVRSSNSTSVQFYENAGYSIEKALSGYYQNVEDAYRMRRDLIDPSWQLKRPK